SLDACLARIGLSRKLAKHSALEDAFQTANLWRFYRGAERPYSLIGEVNYQPTNYQAPPPTPESGIPRRKSKPGPKALPRPESGGPPAGAAVPGPSRKVGG